MLGGRKRSLSGSATAVRISAILTAVGCCLAAAAYATMRSAAPGTAAGGERSPLRPRIVAHPAPVTTEATARFTFSQPGRPAPLARPGPSPRLECKLDAGPWEDCKAPVTLNDIGAGHHRFAVHAVNRAGNESPAAAFAWRRTRDVAGSPVIPSPLATVPPARPVSPTATGPPVRRPPAEAPPAPQPEARSGGPPFIVRQIGTLGELFPGAPAETIGVLIENPNQAPITVTSLTASIVVDPPACPAMENFILTSAAVTPAAPLVVAGESAVSLPEAGIAGPTIAMADLPHSQDSCEGDELEIALSGRAG